MEDENGDSDVNRFLPLPSSNARSHFINTPKTNLYLKVLIGHEGEGGVQLRLLLAPAVRQEGVPDQRARLQPGVEVEGDVAAVGDPQVHAEAGRRRDETRNGGFLSSYSLHSVQYSLDLCVDTPIVI